MIKRSWNSKEPLEIPYWSLGYSRIVGIDEVGRGAIAGPLVLAGVVLPKDFSHPGIKDSKSLTPKQRALLAEEIKRSALSFTLAWIEVEKINQIGIFKAFLMGAKKVLEELDDPDLVLIDGPTVIPDYTGLQKAVVKGDTLSLSIAAASIIAKVERDRFMEELDSFYPGYGFSQHKGYATSQHIRALQTYGPTPMHRISYSCFLKWTK